MTVKGRLLYIYEYLQAEMKIPFKNKFLQFYVGLTDKQDILCF